jgi:hypothetical protein
MQLSSAPRLLLPQLQLHLGHHSASGQGHRDQVRQHDSYCEPHPQPNKNFGTKLVVLLNTAQYSTLNSENAERTKIKDDVV